MRVVKQEFPDREQKDFSVEMDMMANKLAAVAESLRTDGSYSSLKLFGFAADGYAIILTEIEDDIRAINKILCEPSAKESEQNTQKRKTDKELFRERLCEAYLMNNIPKRINVQKDLIIDINCAVTGLKSLLPGLESSTVDLERDMIEEAANVD